MKIEGQRAKVCSGVGQGGYIGGLRSGIGKR